MSCFSVSSNSSIGTFIIEGIKDSIHTESLYLNLLRTLLGERALKNYGSGDSESLRKKVNTQLEPIFENLNNPIDYLDYGDSDTSKNKSPGYNSEKYLEVILTSEATELIFIDQPEDNLGNAFIAEKLVALIRAIKFKKQIFLVTHNPSIVVHGDAENIIIANNSNNTIKYAQAVIEDKDCQVEICKILDGGEFIFHTRSRKYNIERILKNNE